MIAIDSNLLIYAHRRNVPEHKRATQVIEHAALAAGGWGLPFPCLAEFWTIVTHSTAVGGPSAPADARAFLENLLRAGAAILEPKPGAGERLLRLAADLSLSGRRIFDLQVALIAFEAGAREIWTNDRDFVRIPGLTVRHPI